MEIPVYNLTGIEDIGKINLKKIAKAAKAIKVAKAAQPAPNAFKKIAKVTKNINEVAASQTGVQKIVKKGGFISKIKSNVKKRQRGMQGIEGVYNEFLRKLATGEEVTEQEQANFRKAKTLLGLETTDYDGFRLAAMAMPYVADIDEQDGGYYFNNAEIAGIFADGEKELIEYSNRADATELGKLKIFKKIGNAVKKVTKSVAKAVTTPIKAVVKTTAAAVKSTANAVKATANVVKAGVQATTGNKTAAKATIKKAGQQAKAAVVQPAKTVAQQTKAIVKDSVINPTKTAVQVTANAVKDTIKIAGKVFKVIFIKINPVTVLMRNSLRALVAINFLGMATKLNVANLTKEQAIKDGYTETMYNDAVKAKKRVVSFFTKMGGKKENIEKAIINGSKRKAIFKKDYNKNTKLTLQGESDATLGAAGTIGAALASVGAFFAKIWNWIKKIIPKVAEVAKKVVSKVGGAKSSDSENTATTEQYQTELPAETENKKINWLPIVAAGAGAVLLMMKK